ncbi:hypothetical protein OG439_19780 [Amycolatopsis sp. NBC_01307]|uniref:hypothetical protein n=1 Tax=Amycolatopsis sp. NBC_01307 TaxID=2903561 RepID=UPI002E143D71|nr:hypothetical protein OG439_19780 [Amycolatopsis sp. NBC_01307]
MIDTRRPGGRPAGGTAIAALVLALVCALWTLWGIGQNLYLLIAVPDREFDWALVVYAFFCAVELVVLGLGAGLLVARRGAGRWLVLVGGVLVAVQAAVSVLIFFMLNGGFDWYARGAVTFLVFGPVMVLPAVTAAVLAALPSTGLWCASRSLPVPHPATAPQQRVW